MNHVALFIGIASLVLAVLHLLVGGRLVARPMLAAPFDGVARDTMHVCWHLVSAQLLLAGIYLTVVGISPTAATGAAVRLVATLYLGYAATFVWIAIASRRHRALLHLGQWLVFLPLGLIGWLCQ